MALTEYVVMPGVDYQNICDAVRLKTNSSTLLTSDQISPLIETITGSDGEANGDKKKNFQLIKWVADRTYYEEETITIQHGLGVRPDGFLMFTDTLTPSQTSDSWSLITILGYPFPQIGSSESSYLRQQGYYIDDNGIIHIVTYIDLNFGDENLYSSSSITFSIPPTWVGQVGKIISQQEYWIMIYKY